MKALRHQRILANAGSGKTYRLVSRYLELLVNGVAPEKIAALTFTRKAAGEFLEKILTRLAEAASSEKAAAVLARDTNFADLTRERCGVLLRGFIEAFPRLSLGTLDSFFGRVARAFPFELGMPGEMSLIDENQQAQSRRQVITTMLDRLSENEQGFEEFLETLRQQNRNQESRDVRGLLNREVESLHQTYLTTPQDASWGEESSIWRNEERVCESGNLLALEEEFRETFYAAHPEMAEEHHEGWEERFRRLRKCIGAGDMDTNALAFATRLVTPSSRNGKSLIYLSKKPFTLPEEILPLARRLGMGIFCSEIDSRLRKSAALWKLLTNFESLWEAQIRGKGSLTFLDITGLLALHDDSTWGHHETGGVSQTEIEFRMDARTDHWLLDEFQDTSRLQWKALKSLVDEVLQNAEGNRTFFFVGDAKQSIYSWRGGDPRLFSEVADYYNSARANHIDCSENLAISWRSVPEITETVNGLFRPSTLEELSESLELPPLAQARWEAAWCDHKSYMAAEGQGCVSRIVVDKGEENAREAATAEHLREVLQRNPNLSCAVLVQTNKRIGEIVQALREAGVNAVAEGRTYPCINNDLGTALLSLLKAIAHPKDSLAETHASMTPLSVLWADRSFADFRNEALGRINSQGYRITLHEWLSALSLTGFPAHCAEAFLDAATVFDTQSTDLKTGVDAFIEFAQTYQSGRETSPDAIRVMTVHAAKGLDFDVVVLPDIADVSLTTARTETIHLQSDDRGEILWGLNLPPNDVCAVEPVLQKATESRRAESCYESLCVAYVALTRAKRALTIITPKTAPTSKAKTFQRVLDHILGPDSVLLGNPAWMEQYEVAKSKPENEDLPAFAASRAEDAPEPSAILPSSTTTHFLKVESLFQAGGLEKVDTGKEVHSLLSSLSWLEESDLRLPKNAAGKMVSQFLQSAKGAALFTRPQSSFLLWREKAFDVVLGGQWISGVFDRVVIQTDDHGSPLSAHLYEFKTEAPTPKLEEKYARQIKLYREALAALLGISEENIVAVLIAVRVEG